MLSEKILKFGCSEALFSCVLRGRFLSKMFAKLSVYFYAYFYLRVFTYKYSISFYIAGGIFTFSGYLGGGGTAVYGLYRYVPL